MRKSKHREKKINFLIEKMGINSRSNKRNAVIKLLDTGKLYTVYATGSGKWSRYEYLTDIYTEFLDTVGIKYNIENDAPRDGQCGTFIKIVMPSIKTSYEYHIIRNKRKTKKRIKIICDFFGITNYIVNDDLSINVNGNIDLYNRRLTQLPLDFKLVTGSFNCSNNSLTTLLGSPNEVNGEYNCSQNKLTDFIGSPIKVDGRFQCYRNHFIDLNRFPPLISGRINSDFAQEDIDHAQATELGLYTIQNILR
jgi:hypothetical protein